MKFLFTADLHGNVTQYQKVFQYLNEQNFDFLILGGDVSPKSKDKRNPSGQKDFFENVFFKLSKSSKKPTYLILGNDDYRCNIDFLRENQESNNYKLIDKPCIIGEYCFIGYSYVPYTPFVWKDWERRDLETDTLHDLREDVVTTGGSVREVIDLVRANGGEVIGVGVVVDRTGGKIDFGVPLESVISIDVVSFEPEDCPLCKAGVPVVKPGSRNLK